ncbi:MAG: glycosyltransferase family 2 protein [Candidatus Bathyarchaeota archaeon]|jgi:cellulose synthase/poly-beta-1,6-N-acetylglucosamine synthase-like glycosyltransferase
MIDTIYSLHEILFLWEYFLYSLENIFTIKKGEGLKIPMQATGLSRKPNLQRTSRLMYVLLFIPFIIAYISWMYFPTISHWVVTDLFKYQPHGQASLLWRITVRIFYTWYTFLAIGVTGTWMIAAVLVGRGHKEKNIQRYPMVSIVVPAFNEEDNIAHCINSLFRCTEEYDGLCEIIVVDDGSSDLTYEVSWASIELNRRKYPRVHGKIVRHSVNIGKIEAVKTGVNKALGSVVAIVDADSWWMVSTLKKLVNYMLLNGKKAVTGYVHPSDGDGELNPYVILQQLEYSQGLGIVRCAQSLKNNVLVVSGAIGLYEAKSLREILNMKDIHSVTEDLEITLEMHKTNAGVGYINDAKSCTMAPLSLGDLWTQRLRWFTGWLHNTSEIHKDLLSKKNSLTLLLWYGYIFEYAGAFIDLATLATFPLLFWFAPDRLYFLFNILIFASYGFLIGIITQIMALKQAYGKFNKHALLFYTPFYPILRLINVAARLTSSVKYSLGERGNWHNK